MKALLAIHNGTTGRAICAGMLAQRYHTLLELSFGATALQRSRGSVEIAAIGLSAGIRWFNSAPKSRVRLALAEIESIDPNYELRVHCDNPSHQLNGDSGVDRRRSCQLRMSRARFGTSAPSVFLSVRDVPPFSRPCDEEFPRHFVFHLMAQSLVVHGERRKRRSDS